MFLLFYKGILQDLLVKVQTNQIRISSRAFKSLNQLHDKATLAASKAQPFLNASDPDYYRLGFVARHAWHFSREFRNLDTSLSRLIPQGKFQGNFEFAMKTMDQCISDLIGDQRSGARPCNITEKCWKFIRSENTTGYMTTHQALYFMVGEVKGNFFSIFNTLSNKELTCPLANYGRFTHVDLSTDLAQICALPAPGIAQIIIHAIYKNLQFFWCVSRGEGYFWKELF